MQINGHLWQVESPLRYLNSGALQRDLALAHPESSPARSESELADELAQELGPGEAAVGYFDDDFPPLLRHIPDPPLVLFYRGCLAALAKPALAIVGARRCTSQGADFAESLARGMADLGFTIVSGLALGIDGAAHRGALSASGATTAFLGSGMAHVYPQSHAALAEQIVACEGLVCSEYASATPPRAFRFPERNRLISGASQAVVVVEAGQRSGSLITARLALEQGRDVMAVPGPVYSGVSRGCLRLIQQGAALITDIADVLQNLGLHTALPSGVGFRECEPSRVSDPARRILAQIRETPSTLDALLVVCDLPVDVVLGCLSELEVAGFVRQRGDGYIATS